MISPYAFTFHIIVLIVVITEMTTDYKSGLVSLNIDSSTEGRADRMRDSEISKMLFQL